MEKLSPEKSGNGEDKKPKNSAPMTSKDSLNRFSDLTRRLLKVGREELQEKIQADRLPPDPVDS